MSRWMTSTIRADRPVRAADPALESARTAARLGRNRAHSSSTRRNRSELGIPIDYGQSLDEDGLRRTAGSNRIELVPLTTFAFQGQPSQTQEIQLIKFIPVEGYVSGALELRVASRTLASTQTIGLVLQPISQAEDEPEATFTTTTGEVAATVSTSAPSAVPGLVLAQLNTPVPAFYRLIVRAVQSAGGGSMSVTVSASLTLREN